MDHLPMLSCCKPDELHITGSVFLKFRTYTLLESMNRRRNELEQKESSRENGHAIYDADIRFIFRELFIKPYSMRKVIFFFFFRSHPTVLQSIESIRVGNLSEH